MYEKLGMINHLVKNFQTKEIILYFVQPFCFRYRGIFYEGSEYNFGSQRMNSSNYYSFLFLTCTCKILNPIPYGVGPYGPTTDLLPWTGKLAWAGSPVFSVP